MQFNTLLFQMKAAEGQTASGNPCTRLQKCYHNPVRLTHARETDAPAPGLSIRHAQRHVSELRVNAPGGSDHAMKVNFDCNQKIKRAKWPPSTNGGLEAPGVGQKLPVIPTEK